MARKFLRYGALSPSIKEYALFSVHIYNLKQGNEEIPMMFLSDSPYLGHIVAHLAKMVVKND